MTVEELTEAEKYLDDLITKCAEENNLSNENLLPIYDGIYDAKLYLNSPLKIMWILKEPYDDFNKDGNPVGGYWHLNKCIFKDPAKGVANNRTLKMISYITYGILNQLLWNDMDNISHNPAIADVLQEIALINLSKMPAYSTTDNNTLKTKFSYWRSVVLKQIEIYNPDVIIFGNTYSYLQNDFPLSKKLISSKNWVNVFDYNGDKLLVDAYHPGNRFNAEDKEEYANGIIKAILNWVRAKTGHPLTNNRKIV